MSIYIHIIVSNWYIIPVSAITTSKKSFFRWNETYIVATEIHNSLNVIERNQNFKIANLLNFKIKKLFCSIPLNQIYHLIN